ncbi:MAG TPA: deoxyribonuclease V [Pyrinomonadaceae bacterium]|jgi:deoxyribonuclease V|nr:deoxyribonuclease V [Pyrinomonadaceae bacterium]
MKITPLHDWNLSPQQAMELQKQLAFEVIKEDQFDAPVKTVAGIDLGYDVQANRSRAVVAVLKFPELTLLESSEAIMPIQFPYVPSLLSFRETPVAVKALEKLQITPDLILCDGQGIAHPRRFGIACHIGLLTNVPSIGVAKSLLVGKYGNLGEERGSIAPLTHYNEEIGVVLRTKNKVQPVYVSVGHKISLETATDYVLRCTTKYRLPETTRIADQMASYRKK